jgi:hypothetical protein
VEESCRGWLRVSIALVLSVVNPVSTPTPHRAGRIPRNRSSSGYCPRSSPRQSAALAAGCFGTHASLITPPDDAPYRRYSRVRKEAPVSDLVRIALLEARSVATIATAGPSPRARV